MYSTVCVPSLYDYIVCFKIHYAKLFKVLSVMWGDNLFIMLFISSAEDPMLSKWVTEVIGWLADFLYAVGHQLQKNSHILNVVCRYIRVMMWWRFLCLWAVEKQCRRHTVFGSVRPWVNEWVCACWKPCQHHITKTSEGNFTQLWSQMFLGS